jgi:hypothetical protein
VVLLVLVLVLPSKQLSGRVSLQLPQLELSRSWLSTSIAGNIMETDASALLLVVDVPDRLLIFLRDFLFPIIVQICEQTLKDGAMFKLA